MTRIFTCILCPNGCEITTEHTDGKLLSCSGNQCDNGRNYVEQELLDPRRTITSSVLVTGGDRPLASVRLTSPIPRDLIFPVMNKIKYIRLQAPVLPGTVLLEDIFGTGSTLITTSSVDKV